MVNLHSGPSGLNVIQANNWGMPLRPIGICGQSGSDIKNESLKKLSENRFFTIMGMGTLKISCSRHHR